jgi:hypothetical protein
MVQPRTDGAGFFRLGDDAPEDGRCDDVCSGLGVACIKGLSVVTPSGDTHQQLLANREEEVFEKLLEIPLPLGQSTVADVTTEELAHVVITMGFDLTRLNAWQICELLKQGKDLRAFRVAVANFASRIPPGLDAEERRRRLRQEAHEVLDEWNRYTRNLPPYAREALVDAALDKVPDKALELGLGTTVANSRWGFARSSYQRCGVRRGKDVSQARYTSSLPESR